MRIKLLIFFLFFTGLSTMWLLITPARPVYSMYKTPPLNMPTPDPLAIPTLPANPGPVDVGRSVYYYHCMPCHGDKGQGLTTAWRQVWEPDHRNCWNRGCHAGRPGDEGFPIPRTISGVVGAPLLEHFPNSENLIRYLSATHPPQRPGALTNGEYSAVTAFLFSESGSQVPTAPPDIHLSPTDLKVICYFLGIVGVLALALARQTHV